MPDDAISQSLAPWMTNNIADPSIYGGLGQLGLSLLANSGPTPYRVPFGAALARAALASQQQAQQNAAARLGLVSSAQDLRMRQAQLQAYPAWLSMLQGANGSPSTNSSLSSAQSSQPPGAAPGSPSSGSTPPPWMPSSPASPSARSSVAAPTAIQSIPGASIPNAPTVSPNAGATQSMGRDPWRQLQAGVIGAAMGFPGAQQMIEAAKTRLQYDPDIQSRLAVAKDAITVDQAQIDQALKQGDTAMAWGLTQKLQQDMHLLHVASQSGTQTRITPQGIYTLDPNTGLASMNGQVSLAPGAQQALGARAAAEAQGKATGDLVPQVDTTGAITGQPGSTYFVNKASLLGGGGMPSAPGTVAGSAPRISGRGVVPTLPALSGSPAASPAGPFSPPPAGAPVRPRVAPTELSPGQRTFQGSQGTLASQTVSEFQQKAENAQTVLAQTQEILRAANDFSPGQFAETRESALNWLNSLNLITPEEKKALGSAQAGDKLSIQLQAAATKQLGSREAAQIFSTMGKSIPNLTLSDNGLQQIGAWMAGISRYDMARAKVATNRASSGDYVGVNTTRNDFIANSDPTYFIFASARPDIRKQMLQQMGPEQGMRFLQRWTQAIQSGWAPRADAYLGR